MEEKVPLNTDREAYPPPSQQYPPQGQPPAGQPYPQAGQPYPPPGQPYPPAGQPYPPAGQPYPPAGQPGPQAGQPYSQVGHPYPQAGYPYAQAPPPYAQTTQPYAPTTQPYPPAGQPHTEGHQYVAPQLQQVTVTTIQTPSSGPLPGSYICSLVMASFVCLLGCWLLAIPAVVLGVMSIVVHRSNPGSARTYCQVGLGLWIASLVVTVAIIILLVAYVPENN